MLTVKEVAGRLGVSSETIIRWIKGGLFPNAYKLNPDGLTSPYRIPLADVEAFEKKRQERQTLGGASGDDL